jgi:hypothetical protein
MTKMTPKYETKLLTGEIVKEYVETFPLGPIKTHCPDKWAFVDLQSGHIYAWDPAHGSWISPPKKAKKAKKALQAAVEAMSKPKPKRKG